MYKTDKKKNKQRGLDIESKREKTNIAIAILTNKI